MTAVVVLDSTTTSDATKTSDDLLSNNVNEKTEQYSSIALGSPKSNSTSNDEETLQKYLPYYSEFVKRKETSILKFNDYKDDPEGYLQAILKKYNVTHPKDLLSTFTNNDDNKGYELRPWIEGLMEKLLPNSNVLGMQQWKTRLFRLFDEALVWFEEPSDGLISQWLHKTETTIKPIGILPLAMITSLKAPTSQQQISDIIGDEDDGYFQLELQIGDEGVIVLRCSDHKQHIKWHECLLAAIFNVEKPLFSKLHGIWRVGEELVKDNTKQIMSEDIDDENMKKKNYAQVRMGPSLILSVQKLRSAMSGSGSHTLLNEQKIIEENKNEANNNKEVESNNKNNNDNHKTTELSNVTQQVNDNTSTNNVSNEDTNNAAKKRVSNKSRKVL